MKGVFPYTGCLPAVYICGIGMRCNSTVVAFDGIHLISTE
jgi:hypothetical protein